MLRHRIDTRTLAQRARWFAQLAALERAGVPLARALGSVAETETGRARDPARRLAAAVAAGRPLSQAAATLGLLDADERRLVEAGENSGTLGTVLARLARRDEARVRLRRRLRARLMMPAAVVVLALLLAPLPALVAGRLTVPGLVLELAVNALGLVLLVALAATALRLGRAYPAGATALERGLLGVPLLGALARRHRASDALETLAMASRAGLPHIEAVELMARSSVSPVLRRELALSVAALRRGAGLSDALDESGCLDAAALALLRAGEASGRVDDSLDRILALQQVQLDQDDAQLAEWLPRLFYFVVVAWLVSQLLGGGTHTTL